MMLSHLQRHHVAGADRVAEVGLAGVRGQREVRVDGAPRHLLILVLEPIGQKHAWGAAHKICLILFISCILYSYYIYIVLHEF